MEAASSENQNRKRTRDDDNPEMVEAKKQESSYSYEQRRYEFHDGIGVFDFPWLKEKEGVIFNSFEEIDHEEEKKFAPDEENFHQSCSSQNYLDGDGDGDGDDSFWSLLVDDLEPLDCIWSCVIDHPLDLGFNKG